MARTPSRTAGENPAVTSEPAKVSDPAASAAAEGVTAPTADIAAFIATDIAAAREKMQDAEVGLAVRSVSPRGRRRSGIAFGPVARIVNPADLDDAQLRALVEDTELLCVIAPLGVHVAD